MEMLIALFVLALSEKDPKIKETLKSVLSFYRENRELLLTISSMQTPSAPASNAPCPAEPRNESASSQGDGVRFLEEFLKYKF